MYSSRELSFLLQRVPLLLQLLPGKQPRLVVSRPALMTLARKPLPVPFYDK